MALEFIKPAYSAVKSVNGETGAVEITAEKLNAATVDYVDRKIVEVQTGGEINLDGYATKEDLNAIVQTFPLAMEQHFYTKEKTEERIAEVFLEGVETVLPETFYTKEEVDAAIENIELTPGPAGKDGEDGKDGYTPVKGVDYFDGEDGEDGKDYVLTEEDMVEIASMVEVPGADVDLSNYYTKEEVNAAITEALNAIGVAEDGEY